MKFIVDSGGDFLASGLNESNCLGILKFADTYGIMQLRDKAKEFALKNIKQILFEEEFLLTTTIEELSEEAILFKIIIHKVTLYHKLVLTCSQ